MIRLLIASDGFLPRWDGVARFLYEIVPRLSDEFEITLLVPRFKGEFDDKRFKNVRVIRFPVSMINIAGYPIPKPKLKTIRKEVDKADIIWSQTIGPIGLLAMRYAYKAEKPLVSYIHSLEWELFSKSVTKSHRLRLLIKSLTKSIAVRSYNKTSLLMVPSEGIGGMLHRQGITTRYRVVHLGVDPEVFQPMDKERQKEKIGLKGRVIGFSGRLSKEKNIETLYRAYLELKERFPDLNLLLIGGGPLEKNFPKAKVTGFVSDIESYLNCLDVYILPSLTETSSLSTMEAMSCGIPCIVSRVGSLKEYIEHGINGFFFPKRSHKHLAEQIKKLLEDDGLRSRTGKTARKTITSYYTWDKTTERIKNIIKKL